jgi:hypothetical protein
MESNSNENSAAEGLLGLFVWIGITLLTSVGSFFFGRWTNRKKEENPSE